MISDNLKYCGFAGMMNFADAVRKGFSKSECVQQINDQASTELSRHLTQSEIAALTKSFTPAQLMIGIRKVYSKILYKKNQVLFQYGYGYLKFQLFLSSNQGFSCEVSPTRTPGDGNCLLHGK